MTPCDLSDLAWSIIEPLLPYDARGVQRANDRCILNGTFWRFHAGSPFADMPEGDGPHITYYKRFVR